MARIVSIKVPEDVSKGDVLRWVAEGLSRRIAKNLFSDILKAVWIWVQRKFLESLRRQGVRYGRNLKRSTRIRDRYSSR